VTYLADATIHLAFFWLMLLPTGSTLTVGQWRRDDAKIWSEWRDRWVPGVAVRCLLANVALKAVRRSKIR
jgi:hypothetical protein